MTRAEVIDQAKTIVLAHGPSNALEFTTELVGPRYGGPAEGTAEFDAIYGETRKQARRVPVPGLSGAGRMSAGNYLRNVRPSAYTDV